MSKQRALRLKAWLLTLCMVISLVPTAAFAAEGKALNYVSLGDSMSNGYGLTNYNENTSGYEGYGDGAYPAVFFEGYLKDLGYTHKAMAMSAMRAEDLHFLLDFPVGNANAISVADGAGFNEATWEATFGAGDKYTHDNFTAPGGRLWRGNAGTNEMAKAYQNAVKNADLISLGIGNANFGVFLMENITNAFGVFGGEKADSDWMKTALNGCDDAMKEKLQTLMDKLSASLSAKLASLGDAAEPMVDAILYTVVSYLVNYAGVLEAIVGLNPDVEVILVGLMDTTNGMNVSFEVQGETRTLALSTVLSLLVEPINTYITTLPAVLQAKGTYKDATFYYAEAPSVQCLVDTFGVAIKENALIRERFHETIVGTESNPGFIWDMAGDMLGDNIPSVEGLTPALVYVSLKQVEDYEAALDSSDADFLQTKYIDPILKVMDDGELTDAEKDAAKTAANAAMNELLSLAFYLSIEAAALEASNAQWGHLDTAALTALVNGNLASVFEPVLGVVKDPGDEFKAILEKNDQMIYDLIAAVASNLAKDALDAEVELTAQHVQDILSGEEDKINEVFFELAAEMVKTMTEENFDGIGKVNLSTLGIDKDAVREIYNETEAGYTKLYEMAAKIVSDMDKLNVDGIGEIDPGKLGITADDIKAIYKVANGIKTEIVDGETVDYEKNANEFYYRMVETLASDLGYDGLTAEDAASIIDPNYEGGLTAHVFAVAQEKYAEEPFEFEVDGKTETFKLSELGLSADGKDLKTVYEYALTPTDKAKEAAADEVFYKIATVVANKTVFKDVDENEQPKEDVIKELITVEDGNYSLAVFKLAMDLAGNQVVYTIKDANNVDKNITLDQLNLSADGKDLKALYDYARNPVDTNPNKTAAYGVYYKMIALVAPEMGFGGLEADDIESVIDETKMPTKAVFEFALDKAGSDVVYEGLTLNQLGVNANDLMALYYFAKGETTVTIDGVEVACEPAADAALYKIAAAVANTKDDYEGLNLTDAHIKSIVEDTVPSAAVFEVALKIAKDEEVYNKDGISVKVNDLGLTGSELRAVYIDAKNGTETTSALTTNTYNKIAAVVANMTTFKDADGEKLVASDIAKILVGVYETKVFDLAVQVAGNKEVYKEGSTVVTLDELHLAGGELQALYEYAKTQNEETKAAADPVLYKIAAAVANKTTFATATGELDADDIENIINKQYDEKLFNLAIQVADPEQVVYTDGDADVTLGDLNLSGTELKALYDYANDPTTTNETAAESAFHKVAAAVANKTIFAGKYYDTNKQLVGADIANILLGNYESHVFELAVQISDDKEVYREGDVVITLGELNLAGGELKLLYEYATATEENKDAREIAANPVLYKVAAAIANKTTFEGKYYDTDKQLVGNDIANIIDGNYETHVFELAVQISGDKEVYDGIKMSELNLTGAQLQTLYNYATATEQNKAEREAAANPVLYEIAAKVAKKTAGYENVTATDIESIVERDELTENLLNIAAEEVKKQQVDGVTITLSPDSIEEINRTGKPNQEMYEQIANFNEVKAYNLTWEDIRDIHAGGDAANQVYYKLAAKELNETYSSFDVNITEDAVESLVDENVSDDVGIAVLCAIAAKQLDNVYTPEQIADKYMNADDSDLVKQAVKTLKESFVAEFNEAVNEEGAKAVNGINDAVDAVRDGVTDAKTTVSQKLANAKAEISGPNSKVTSAVAEQLGQVTAKLADAKGSIRSENSLVKKAVTEQLGQIEAKLDAAKADICGENSSFKTTVNGEFNKVEEKLNSARTSITSENSLVVSAVDDELNKVKSELDKAKQNITKEDGLVARVDKELDKVKSEFTNAKAKVADPDEAFMTKVEEKFAEVRADFNEAVYGDENDPNDGANGEILAAVNENVGKVKDQFRKAKDMISGENSEIVSKVDSTLKDVRDNFASAQEKVSDLVKTGVDGARDKIKTSIDEAKELIKGYDLNNYFDLIRKLFAMDELVPEAAKESETLMSLLHLFSRMLIGNGLGAHPNTTGHAALAEAVKEAYVNKHTVQDELKQDIGLLMLGMGGLLVKFGTDILGIALDTDTIKGYLNDLPAAAEALMQALDEKFKDYETSKNTLNNAISALEAKLDALTARLEKLSTMLEGKQQELADAFKMAANANNKAADTAVKNLKAVVQELATLITETRNAITTTKQLLTEAKTQLVALENAMVELKNAVATLKNGVDGMNALLTNVNTTIDKFVAAYKTASDTVMKGIDAVKVAYDKSEDALEKARGYAVKATNKAEEIYDGMYKTLADLYDDLPADMALVLFGAVGGGAYVTLELTKATLVPYAEARIAEKQAELEAKAADLNAKIAEKKEALKDLSDNAAAKAQLEDEINKLETQLAALEDQINAEITDLRIGIEEANAGNLTKLKADYQKLIETITSGARSGIKDAMDDVAASAVKTTARLVTSTIEAISDAIRFVDAKIDQVVREAKNVYTEATGDEYTITENSLYVALGDSAAAAENSYVKLLAEATNEDKTTKIPFANLAVANQSVGEAVNHINNNKETIAAADLITVGYGNTTFGKMAVDRANAVVKGETPAAYDWKSVVGNEGAAYVKDTINSIKSSLIAAGLNKEGDNYAEAVAAAVEAYAYAAVEYLVKLPSVINAIRDINDSAKIVIVGMYNPLNGLVLNHSADGATISLEMGDYLSKLVSGMNVYGTSYAMLATRTDAKAIFVEAPAAQVAPVDGDDNVMPMDAFLAWCADGVINVAPTANGQQYIADQILGALDITDQTENLTGTVTIEGELVYDEELTALYEGNATNVDYQWYRNGEPITGATEQTYTTTAADVGKTLTVKVIGTGKYKGDTTSVGKTIDKAEYPNAADLEVTAQYGQILAEVDLPDNWTWDPADLADDVGAAGSTNTWDAVYTPTAAEATVDGVVVYGPVVKAVTVTVEKAPVTEEIYTAPKELEHGLTENGQTLTLVEPGTIADGYGEQVKIMYLVTEDPDYDPTEDPDADWSEVVPTATEAGTYYVWYYVDGGNNYESTDPQCIVVTVAEALATLLGDVDLDGDVDSDDLTALARHVAKIEFLTKAQALRNAEVTGDGDVDSDDLTRLARHVAKIEFLNEPQA